MHIETIAFVATDVTIRVVVVLIVGAKEECNVTSLVLDNLGCMICVPDESGYSIAAEMNSRIGPLNLRRMLCPLQATCGGGATVGMNGRSWVRTQLFSFIF